MKIRELAQQACMEARERRQENTRQSNIAAAGDALRLLKETLGIELEPGDVRLDAPYIVVDDLRFSYHYDDETGTEVLHLARICSKCGRQYKANIYNLETLGVELESRNGHGCFQQPEDRHPICPVMSSGEFTIHCAFEQCQWWNRCRAELSVNELSDVVAPRAEPPAAPPQWARVELMGHDSIVGQVSESQVAGVTMVRVDVPAVNGQDGYSRYIGRGAIFRLTPLDEAQAQAMLSRTASRVYVSDVDGDFDL